MCLGATGAISPDAAPAAANRLVERRAWLRMATTMTMGEISATQRLDSQVTLRGLPAAPLDEE